MNNQFSLFFQVLNLQSKNQHPVPVLKVYILLYDNEPNFD